jgi:hypothetical protein
MDLTQSFQVLLLTFSPVFTQPSFATFQALMAGWIISPRHRYITDLIISSDSVENGHFSNYHRFFSQAVWDIDQLWKLLAQLMVQRLVGDEAVIYLAGDDTLCHKRGLGIFGTGMHHDACNSSKSKKLFHWGHDWVNLCLIIDKPWWAPTKVFALPICMRLYRNQQGLVKGKNKVKKKRNSARTKAASKKSKAAAQAKKKAAKKAQAVHKNNGLPRKTRPELMAEMIALVADWFPNRKFVLVVDSLYSGKSVLSNLPDNFDLVGPVHAQAALYEPAPKESKRRGRRRKKGKRMSSAADWENDRQPWKTYHFNQYGLQGSLRAKEKTGLYYTAGKDRLLRFVLSQDTVGGRPTRIFYSTNLNLSAKKILSTFSLRWSIEVTHYDCKQQLGLEDPANRVPQAVERTAPMSMFLYSLTILWFATEGHNDLQFPKRPWYHWKSEPSFRDMLTTLRRKTWEDKFSMVSLKPTPEENPVELLTYLATLAG